ncbi:MAG: nitrite/sulfite reductase [Deltaproteobacteria bacterium]|jgi:sulfite reductase (NADPH) hemoprotein beta-component
MYRYDEHDRRLVEERARQFRGQVARRLSGELTEEEFRPLRLQNGLYIQLHAYMLRIAIPYGLLSAAQLRKLAHIARTYDRGYGHFTTRQNLQLNWVRLEDVPNILDELASVEMHAIQTSGNCVRNVTSDPFAGVARDEDVDPRPYCELLRQYSTFHPEFAYLPRKFKIAVTGSRHDRAAIAVHDIGLRVLRGEDGSVGFEVFVGGGQGRTPVLATRIRAFLAERDLLSYTEAILRVYNELGRRDNIYKARIKILVNELGAEEFARLVDEEWDRIRNDAGLILTPDEIARVARHFEPAPYEPSASTATLEGLVLGKDRALARWVEANVIPHRVPGYAIAQLSLKSEHLPPGDATDAQLEAVADLADRFSFGRAVVTHRQNLVLTDVKIADLPALHAALVEHRLATPNVGRITDIVACPGLDYCDLANARSIPVAQEIAARLRSLEAEQDLGPISLNISGCINACGHHHVGNLGILGIDKLGEEFYQLTLGGDHTETAAIGKILGRAFAADEIAAAVEKVVRTYLALRESPRESFLAAYRRVGPNPFKESVYGAHPASSQRTAA